MALQRFLRAEELATITGVPKSTLFHMAQANRIPHVHFGRNVRFPEEDIERWIQEQMQATGCANENNAPRGGSL